MSFLDDPKIQSLIKDINERAGYDISEVTLRFLSFEKEFGPYPYVLDRTLHPFDFEIQVGQGIYEAIKKICPPKD